jgi:PIN domain
VAEGLWRVAGRGALPAPQLPDQSTYQEQLVERPENLGIEFLPWPETPHEEIVKRATERRPPFDEAGSGYRDTLVWMSCLALAGAGRTVFLVSQDRDFAGRDLDLAGALIKEVTDLSGSVTLVRHLGAWLLTLVPWGDVGDLKEAAANARDEEVASIFAPWDIFEGQDFTRAELGLPPSAVIDEINYYGSDGEDLERVSHARKEDGSHKIVYSFPIEFEVRMTLDTDEARAEGYTAHEGSLTGRETVRTVIPMIGEMTVIHDEGHPDEPLYYDSFDFRPVDPSAHYDPNPGPIPGQGVLLFEADGSYDG